MYNQQLYYKLNPHQAVVLDAVVVDGYGEKTAIFHYCDGLSQGARTAKVKYTRKGEGYFVASRQKVFFNDMRKVSEGGLH